MASRVVAYHFCQADNAPTVRVADFVHSLAAQLSQAPALRPYNAQLAREHDLRSKLTPSYCLARPSVALEEGVLEPLRSVQGIDGVGGQPCVVLVDGLSEGEGEEHRSRRESTVAEFIAEHLDKFPSWIKFVVTVRSDTAVGSEICKALPFHQLR